MKNLGLMLVSLGIACSPEYEVNYDIVPSSDYEETGILDVLPPAAIPRFVYVPEGELSGPTQGAVDFWNQHYSDFPCLVFEPVGDPELSDVTVSFGDLDHNYAGYASSTVRSGRISKTRITVNNEREWSDVSLTAVITHELGHALGLEDDSDCSSAEGSLMCSVLPYRYGLSEADYLYLYGLLSCD